MVPIRLEDSASRARRAACLAGALILVACARRETGSPGQSVGADTSEAARAGLAVRSRYGSPDAEAAGAWMWASPQGGVFVLVDVQSTVAGIVQGRADLWLAGDSGAILLGRSDAMPAAAEIGAYTFEDLTGDGLPDLFGYVADSSDVRYPVFIPGGRGALAEEIEATAPSWRFSTDQDHAPDLVRRGGMVCALQLWAQAPAPDNGPEGWRWLPIRAGHLGAPVGSAPDCGAGSSGAAGLQPDRGRP